MARYRALVFDLDGVIVESEGPIFDAWRAVYAAHGAELSLAEWSASVGTSGGGRLAYESLRDRADRPVPSLTAIRAELRERQRTNVAAMRPLPGVTAWIEEARRRGLALGIASSSSARWVGQCLEATGLADHFAVRACPDELHASKPAPDLYLAACRQLGVEPPRAIAIEDSANGVRAARAAGLACLAVTNAITGASDFSDADHRIASLLEYSLEELLELLEARSSAC